MDHSAENAHARPLLDELRGDIKSSSPMRTAYLMTSTRSSIKAVGDVAREFPGIPIIGGLVQGSMKPTTVLAAVRHVVAPRVLIVFSDQLITPDVALIPFQPDGDRTYFSAFEPILFSKYGYTLKTCLGDRIETLSPPGAIGDAVDLLRRYFVNAAHLGAAWIAEEWQGERTLRGRLRDARLRSNLLRSSIYRLYADQPLDESGRVAISRLDDLDRQLREVQN